MFVLSPHTNLYSAKQEEERAKQIVDELNAVKEQRLFATLQSPNTALSSNEAREVLERLHIEDTVSIVDRAMLRHTIEEEIQSLSETEDQFTEKLQVYEETDREWNFLLGKQEVAKNTLTERKNEEIEARKALADAQKNVSEAKEELVDTSKALSGVEQQVKKYAQEMDRITATLSKKQERVRNELKKKAELMQGGIQMRYMSEEELAALRRRELQLLGESQQIADMVARLESRSIKLKNRAEKLKEFQKVYPKNNSLQETEP